MICTVRDLGVMPFADAWAVQSETAAARANGGSDTLLLVEHLHVYTLGTMGDDSNVLMSEAQRRRLGIEVVRTDRGGDVTYHGHGQLVAYPILQLPRQAGQVHANVIGYVRRLEQVVIAFLAEYGVEAKTVHGITGVWVDTPMGEAKIAAIGARVNVRGITTHGLALNLNTDLRYFSGIIPCGIRDRGVTSLAALFGGKIDEDEAKTRFVRCFAEVFGYDMEWVL
jgi:lipoate-protein ligase B